MAMKKDAPETEPETEPDPDTPVLKLSFSVDSSEADVGFDLLSGLMKKRVDLVVLPPPLTVSDVPDDQLPLTEGEG